MQTGQSQHNQGDTPSESPELNMQGNILQTFDVSPDPTQFCTYRKSIDSFVDKSKKNDNIQFIHYTGMLIICLEEVKFPGLVYSPTFMRYYSQHCVRTRSPTIEFAYWTNQHTA